MKESIESAKESNKIRKARIKRKQLEAIEQAKQAKAIRKRKITLAKQDLGDSITKLRNTIRKVINSALIKIKTTLEHPSPNVGKTKQSI